MSSYLEKCGIEEARIAGAYDKRKGDSRYSWFKPDYLLTIQERERQVLNILKRNGFSDLGDKKIFEIGCGNGYWLREFVKWGVSPLNIAGIELLPDRVAEAKRLCPSGVRIDCGNGAQLPFPDKQFDLVLQSTVFTSVLDWHVKKQMASELLRVLKDKGLMLWYDFHVNNPWNSDVKGVTRAEIKKLFPNCRIELRRITLAPPLCRIVAPYSLLACYLLEKIKILNTHYLGVIQKVPGQ